MRATQNSEIDKARLSDNTVCVFRNCEVDELQACFVQIVGAVVEIHPAVQSVFLGFGRERIWLGGNSAFVHNRDWLCATLEGEADVTNRIAVLIDNVRGCLVIRCDALWHKPWPVITIEIVHEEVIAGRLLFVRNHVDVAVRAADLLPVGDPTGKNIAQLCNRQLTHVVGWVRDDNHAVDCNDVLLVRADHVASAFSAKGTSFVFCDPTRGHANFGRAAKEGCECVIIRCRGDKVGSDLVAEATV